MNRIFKYQVPLQDSVSVPMPEGARILSAAGTESDTLMVWAIVDTDAPLEDRTLLIRGTGHPLGTVGDFIATIQDGTFVWHLFDAPARVGS